MIALIRSDEFQNAVVTLIVKLGQSPLVRFVITHLVTRGDEILKLQRNLSEFVKCTDAVCDRLNEIAFPASSDLNNFGVVFKLAPLKFEFAILLKYVKKLLPLSSRFGKFERKLKRELLGVHALSLPLSRVRSALGTIRFRVSRFAFSGKCRNYFRELFNLFVCGCRCNALGIVANTGIAGHFYSSQGLKIRKQHDTTTPYASTTEGVERVRPALAIGCGEVDRIIAQRREKAEF